MGLRNYSDAESAEIQELYALLGNDGLHKIANKFGRNRRSIIAKLVNEGVYQKPTVEAKRSDRKMKDLVAQLERILEIKLAYGDYGPNLNKIDNLSVIVSAVSKKLKMGSVSAAE